MQCTHSSRIIVKQLKYLFFPFLFQTNICVMRQIMHDILDIRFEKKVILITFTFKNVNMNEQT